MKFGLGQVLRETPKAIKRLRAVINYVLGTALISTGALTNWFNVSPQDFAELMGMLIIGCNSLLIMFGVNPADEEETDSVINNSSNPDKPRGGN